MLYGYDSDVAAEFQGEFPRYVENFRDWARQARMLRLSIWDALRELGIGASLQHYNPVIDEKIRALFDLPDSYVLVAQMPFGETGAEPEDKEKEDIEKRVRVEGRSQIGKPCPSDRRQRRPSQAYLPENLLVSIRSNVPCALIRT